jgi:hypothetical protein
MAKLPSKIGFIVYLSINRSGNTSFSVSWTTFAILFLNFVIVVNFWILPNQMGPQKKVINIIKEVDDFFPVFGNYLPYSSINYHATCPCFLLSFFFFFFLRPILTIYPRLCLYLLCAEITGMYSQAQIHMSMFLLQGSFYSYIEATHIF